MKANFQKLLLANLVICNVLADNQTASLSPLLLKNYPNFIFKIEKEDFELPIGIQNSAVGVSGNKWVFISGRKNGLHGFNNDNNNFPTSKQNDFVIVVDIAAKTTTSRQLIPADIGQALYDSLTVTNAQHIQEGNTLYMTGGYGWDTIAADFKTQDKLTAINVPSLIAWVESGAGALPANTIRQTSNPLLQVTGGEMRKLPGQPVLLMVGQNFTGAYSGSSEGAYTQQIRRFTINDDGITLSITPLASTPATTDPILKRRDLNVASITRNISGTLTHSFSILAGVFFPPTDGAWTVPVNVSADGLTYTMADPTLPGTFKQGANIYASSTIGLFSETNNEMHTIILGGITFQFLSGNTITSDSGFPFSSQTTVISIDKDGNYKQYLLNSTFPDIKSTAPLNNPGSTLLFGAESIFIPVSSVPAYPNGVFKFDEILNQCTVVGYIVGGIMSTMSETNTMNDSGASPYIFKVTIKPYVPVPNQFSKDLVDKYGAILNCQS